MGDKRKQLKQIFMQSLIIFFGLALSILFFFLLFQTEKLQGGFQTILSILRPFIIGAVIAYILKSTCNFLEKYITKFLKLCKMKKEAAIKKISAISSLVLTYAIWLSIIAILLKIVIPQLVESIFELIEQVPTYMDDLKIWSVEKLANTEAFKDSAEAIVNGAYDFVYGWVDKLMASVQNIEMDTVSKILASITGVISIVFDSVIGLIISFFLLMNRRQIAAKCTMLVHSIFKEKAANAIIKEVKFADSMFSGFLEGKVIDSSLIGVLYYIALSIMNIPYAPLIAVLCGVTNIIPIFGPFIGAIPSSLIILAGGEPIKVVYFVIFVLVMQMLDGYIIDPMIVGDHVNVSSLSVIFAVITFGGLWGFFGLLIGVPTYAVIYDIIKRIVCHTLKKRGKHDLVEKFNSEYRKGKANDAENSASSDMPAETHSETHEVEAAVEAVVEAVEASVEATVEAAVGAAVEAAVEAAVGATVEAAVKAAVEAAVEATAEATSEATVEAE